MTGGVDVCEELLQFLIRLENPVLRHILDRLDWPDALARNLLIDGLRTSVRRLFRIAALLAVIPPPYEERRTSASITRRLKTRREANFRSWS